MPHFLVQILFALRSRVPLFVQRPKDAGDKLELLADIPLRRHAKDKLEFLDGLARLRSILAVGNQIVPTHKLSERKLQ